MRRLMLLAVSMLAVVSMSVSPVFAHDSDGDGWDEDNGFWIGAPSWDFWGEPEFDVEFEDAGNDSDLDGECYVEDIDWDGWISEWEITCYY